MITIRKAKLHDIKAIVELDLELYRHHDQYHREDYDHLPNSALHKVLCERRKRYIFSQQATIFVAEDDGRSIGFITASIKKRPPMFRRKWTGYIGSIYVEEDYRQQGIGQSLIQKVLDWLKERKIELISANIDLLNESSIILFKKQGFIPYQYVVLKEMKE